MTEEEAKTKWCPHVRITNDDTGDWKSFRNNRGKAGDNLNHNCIGSACMMWRWQTKSVLFDPKTKEMAPAVWGQSYDGSKFIHMDVDGRENGFCGLAGKP